MEELNKLFTELLQGINISRASIDTLFTNPLFLVFLFISLIIIIIGLMKLNIKAKKTPISVLFPLWREWNLFRIADRNPFELIFMLALFLIMYFGREFVVNNIEILYAFSLFSFSIVLYLYISVISKIGVNFNKSIGYRVLMLIMPFVFLPIIGFDKSTYLDDINYYTIKKVPPKKEEAEILGIDSNEFIETINANDLDVTKESSIKKMDNFK